MTQSDKSTFTGFWLVIPDLQACHTQSLYPQIQYISSKISKSLAILQKLIKTINISNLQNLYYSFIYPYLINGITVWGSAGATALNPVIKLQKRLVRILSSSPRYEHTAPLFKKLKFLPLEYLFKYAMLIYSCLSIKIICFHKYIKNVSLLTKGINRKKPGSLLYITYPDSELTILKETF